MLDALQADVRILHWVVQRLAAGERATQRGQRAVWKLGADLRPVPRWCWIRKRSSHRRTLFIVQVYLDFDRSVLWLCGTRRRTWWFVPPRRRLPKTAVFVGVGLVAGLFMAARL